MDKETRAHAPKDDNRRHDKDHDTDHGVIVAGPDAHTREQAGKTPSDSSAKSKDQPSRNPQKGS